MPPRKHPGHGFTNCRITSTIFLSSRFLAGELMRESNWDEGAICITVLGKEPHDESGALLERASVDQ
jgi:hypothetical protein